MTLKQQEYSLTKQRPSDHESLGSSSFTDEVIIIDDDEVKETLGLNKNKKQRVGSWRDESDVLNELDCVVKKDAASVVGLSSLPKSKAKKCERALSLIQRDNFLDLCNDESHDGGNNKRNQDPLLGRYKNTKEDNERSLSSSHHDNNFIGLCEDEIIGESSGRSNKGNQLDECIDLSEDKIRGESCGSYNNGNGHVSLEELGVSVEDLKSMPWEAFDPTWEIRSETMDPWLGGYVKDMLSSAD